MVDINRMYKTLPERMAAARSALMRTSYGMGGAIKIETDGDEIKFVLSATGESFKSIERAFAQAGTLRISQFNNLDSKPGQSRLGSKVSGMAEVMSDVKAKSQTFSTSQIKLLQDAGIDVSSIKDMQVDILTLHEDKGGVKDIAMEIRKLRERGTLQGITVIDDESARLITMRAGGKMLTSYQSNLLLSVTGHDMLDPGVMSEKVLSKNPNKLRSGRLVDHLLKIPKRFRSLASEREVSLAGGDLENFVGKKGSSTFSASIFVLDPQYELLKKMTYQGTDKTKVFGNTMRGKELAAYYKNVDAEDFVGSILNQFTKKQRTEFENVIRSANFAYKEDNKTGKFASDQLMAHLQKYFVNGDKKRASLVKQLFDNIEYAYDGSDLMNAKKISGYTDTTMRKEINVLKNKLKNAQQGLGKPLSSQEMEDLAIRIKQLENIKGQTSRAQATGGLDQFTIRGHAAKYGDLKTAGQAVEFDKQLEKYTMIASKFAFKPELGFAGKTDILTLSGMGSGRDLVYSDPVSTAFHPEVFADRATLDAMEQRGQSVLREFESAINSNTVPRKVRAMLEEASQRDISHLPSHSRLSAARNKEFADSILDMMRRGISPKQNPTMMNMMHTFFATEAFRMKGDFMQMVVPDTHRFAIDSEAILMGTEKGKMILNKGRGYDRISIEGLGDVKHDILKFRVSGHKMMLPADSIGKYRHALGGFDLDDKVLEKVLTYKDNQGLTRLGFNISRQPSGPEELIFARMNMDQDTIRGLFGGKEDSSSVMEFRKSLDSLTQSTSNTAHRTTYRILQDILDGKHTTQRTVQGQIVTTDKLLSAKRADAFEQAILNVFGDLEQRGVTTIQKLDTKRAQKILEHGSSTLSVEDLSKRPDYTREGIFKAFIESGSFDMKDDFLETMRANNFDQKMINKFSKAADFEEMLKMMQSTYETDPALRAIFQTAIDDFSVKKAIEGGDILGVYVNRSMTVGSVLNQYEAFLNDAGTSMATKQYMLKNYKIGLLAQDEAIDASVGVSFASSRNLSHDVGSILSAADNANYVNDVGVQKALSKLGLSGADLGLEVFGGQSIEGLGKMIGFSRAVGSSDDSLLLGIDEFLLKDRIRDTDTKSILDNMITGMEDAQRQGLATAVDLDKTLEELKEVSATNDASKIREELIKRIGLNADHSFASISRVHDVGVRYSSYLDSVNRSSISRIPSDDILSSTRTSREADSVARSIINTHKDELDRIFDTTTDSIKTMNQTELFNHSALLDNIGQKVLTDIDQASKLIGMSSVDLVNAIDKVTAGTRVDIGGLRHLTSLQAGELPEDAERAAETIQNVRDYRRVKHYESFDQDYANQVRASLGNKSTMEDLVKEAENKLKSVKEAQQRIDAGHGMNIQGLQQDLLEVDNEFNDTYRALVGQAQEITDDMVRGNANHQTALITSQMQKEQLAQAGLINLDPSTGLIDELSPGTLGSMGSIDVDDARAAFGDDGLADNIINSITDLDDGLVENKAVYKRIGEKMGDLKDLFKNPTIKKGALAIGGLIAGSLAYSEIRDRTHEDMAGPPLLPGGSAYESGYPNRVPQIGTFGGPGYDPGVSYKVNLYGDQDTVGRFNAAAGGLVNGNINTTMYNRIPNVAQDPYAEMAANY